MAFHAANKAKNEIGGISLKLENGFSLERPNQNAPEYCSIISPFFLFCGTANLQLLDGIVI